MYVIDQGGNPVTWLGMGMLTPVKTYVTVHPMTQEQVLVAVVDPADMLLGMPNQLMSQMQQER